MEMELKDILEKLDAREIDSDTEIVVEGFLSRYGPLNEPETYVPIVYSTDRLSERKGLFEVKSLSLPVVLNQATGCGESVGFLYVKEVDRPYEFDWNEENLGLEVALRNQYIPIVMSEDMLTTYGERVVKVSCHAEVGGYEAVQEMYAYRNREYKELSSLYIDEDNERIKTMLLVFDEVLEAKEVPIESLKMVYAVEYEITSDTLSVKAMLQQLTNGINSVMNVGLGLKAFETSIDEGVSIISFLSRNGVHIKVYEDRIGFYTEMDMFHKQNLRLQKQLLEETTKTCFKYAGKKIKKEILFITDYRDFHKFE